jgi:hypothetical protein
MKKEIMNCIDTLSLELARRLSGAGADLDRRPTPRTNDLKARILQRLATRVARIAAETGGRIQVFDSYPRPHATAPSPHHHATDLRDGYAAPETFAERAKGVAAVSKALRDTNLPIEYAIMAEGKRTLFVGNRELSLDRLSAEEREVFDRFDDFLELTS